MQLLSTLNSLDNVADGSTRKLLKTATSSGSGNAVTAVSISGDTLTYTKGSTFSLSNHTHDNVSTSAAGFMSAADKIKLDSISSYYGTCSTAAGTQAKVVTCDNFVLETGSHIRVLFTNAQTYNGAPTLNVNNTGAKTVRHISGTNAVRYIWSAGELVDFTYNGTYWIIHERALATTTYYGVTKLATSATSTSTSTALTPSSLNSFAQNMIANYPVYSSSSTYAVGDRVRYSYKTYECITAITTAEAWTAAHWEALDPIQTQIDNGVATGVKLASPQQTYYLTGVQTITAGVADLYNSYMSSSYTGVKYVTSATSTGGALYVDDKEVVTGLYYEIS